MKRMIKYMLILQGIAAIVCSQTVDDVFQWAQAGDVEKIKTYISGDQIRVHMKDNRDCTLLHYAINGGFEDLVTVLIDEGADIHAVDADGDTPLHWAAFAGHATLAGRLLEHGARIDSKNRNGQTALAYAVMRRQKEMIDFLVAQGAEVEVGGEWGRILLHTAAANGYGRLTETMIQKGANILSLQDAGGSLLHSAAAGGLEALAGKLILGGADVNLNDRYGRTPLDEAQGWGHAGIVQLLLSNGAVERSRSPVVAEGPYLGQKNPGFSPELFAPGVVSTGEWDERDITFSPDLKSLYFTRYSRARRQGMTIMTMRMESGRWSEPDTASFSGRYADAEPFITHDGGCLYFISRRPSEVAGDPSAWEMWKTEQIGLDWITPVKMPPLFQGGFYPTVTSAGTMYYTAADNDIHRSVPVNGEYLQSENLGSGVNTEAVEYNSCIAPDESYLIYSSLGFDDSFGRGDLYVSFRKPDGTWTPARNMGESINSSAEDYCPAISPDGEVFFFSSARFGNEDIFWLDAGIIQDLK